MVHFAPEWVVHFTPEWVVHFAPKRVVHFAPEWVVHYDRNHQKTDKTPELKEVSLEFTTTYMIGLNFDIKFGKEDYLFRPKSSYGFLRVRYAYNIARFQKKYDGISGNMHYITIGVGGMARGLKREY